MCVQCNVMYCVMVVLMSLFCYCTCRSKDDLDFDEFLESVKARQHSMTMRKTHTCASACTSSMYTHAHIAALVTQIRSACLVPGPF